MPDLYHVLNALLCGLLPPADPRGRIGPAPVQGPAPAAYRPAGTSSGSSSRAAVRSLVTICAGTER
jgi:hypothetical protein